VTSEEALVRELVAEVTDLRPLLRKHLEDNLGEMLPHLFFGDISRWALDQESRPTGALSRLLSLLEDAFEQGVPEVQELLVVSFLENLPSDSSLWDELGPRLTAARPWWLSAPPPAGSGDRAPAEDVVLDLPAAPKGE
jgi:hypothetical protein